MGDELDNRAELINEVENDGFREETDKDRDIIALDVAIQMCCRILQDLCEEKRRLEAEVLEEAHVLKSVRKSRLSIYRDRFCVFVLNMSVEPDSSHSVEYGWDMPPAASSTVVAVKPSGFGPYSDPASRS